MSPLHRPPAWALLVLAAMLALPASAQDAPARRAGPIGIAVPSTLATPLREASPPVTGQPFRFSAVTRTVQRLSDGNEIVTETRQEQARDSQGRTWMTLRHGPGHVSPGPDLVVIQDPVAKVLVHLFPHDRTGVKSAWAAAGPADADATLLRSPRVATKGATGIEVQRVPLAMAPAVAATFGVPAEGVAWQSRSLGTRTLLGHTARGTRMVSTLPAGAIGNRRPIRSEIEHWVAVDLGIALRTQQVDPLMGVTEYTVEALDTREPDPSLFEVPSDYRFMAPPVGGPTPAAPSSPSSPTAPTK